MATITGTSGNDFIDPAGNTSGVTGGLPGAGADSILGLDGGDTLNGGDGSDTLDGGTGRDILHGGNGDDVIIVGALSENNDYAYGDAGNDELRGRTTAGVNGFFVYLDGGTGNDTLRGFGIGETIADYRARSGPITAVLGTTGGATLPGGEIDVLDSILHIAGSQGADTITGSSANEVFMAGAGGADSINGGGGTDRIEYYDYLPAAGATTGPGVTVDLAAGRATVGGAIQTLAGIEDVSGSDFDDVLLGDAGANIFRAVAGNDTIDGRDGFDIMRYATAAGLVAPWILSTQAGVNVNLATGIATDPWGFTDRLTSIEGIYGVSGQNDTITGSSVDERFFATTGSDSYTGGGGADRLDYSTLTNAVTITWTSATGGTAAKASGGGTDSFSGIAYFNGSTGADTFNGAITHATAKYYYGAAGNDTISGAGSPFSIADYSNTASTAAIVANLATGKVNDGLGGTDTLLSVVALRGSTNADTILGGAPETSWKIDGGGGADLLDYRAYATPITLTGVTNAGGNAAFFSGSIGKGPGFGTDSFTGIRGIYATVAGDSLQGTADTTGANNFVLRGEAGNDTIDGQGGFNYLDYFDSPNGVDVNLASGVAQDGWGGTDSVAGFTRMRGSDNGNDTLVGTSNGNTFIATRGSDLYNGNGGSDSVDYNGLFRDGFVGPVTVTFTGVAAGLFGYANASVAKPSGATDALTGINTVNATSAADTLFGLQGVAYSWNTAVLRGNAGNDTLYGYGSQANKADYNNSTAAVSLDLAAGTAQDGLGGTDTLIGIVQARASNNNDTMLGAATNDRFISGSSGAHLFNGRGGTNDIMYAGADDVTLDLGTVATADGFGGYQGSIAKTTGIDTALNFANAQGGSGNDSILGSPGNNQLSGASGSNSIDGRAGYDTLNYRYFSNLTAPTHGATADLKDGIAGTAVNPWDGIDTLLNIEAVTGTQFADDLTGALLAGGVRSFVRGDGGNDVLRAPGTDSAVTADYLNSLTAVTIDLKQGKALDDGWFGGQDTLVNIQSIRASAFADSITGGDRRDTIEGGLGDDSIGGGAGRDVAILNVAANTATWTRDAASNTWTVTSADGTDALRNVETLQFTDRSIALPAGAVANDLDGAGASDILWRYADGTVARWTLAGFTVSGGTIAGVGTDWTLRGTADFNGDGRADLLWRGADGTVAQWWMKGGSYAGGGTFAKVDLAWKIAGMADMDGDGRANILWRNDDGSVALWRMDGKTFLGGTGIGNAGTAWKVAGLADFDADGRADILWRNDDGTIVLWRMDGATFRDSATIATPGAAWKIAGTGDVNGDGKADLVWRHDDGTVAVWTMDGLTATGGASLGNPGTAWAVIG